jgi:hypothetical protein
MRFLHFVSNDEFVTQQSLQGALQDIPYYIEILQKQIHIVQLNSWTSDFYSSNYVKYMYYVVECGAMQPDRSSPMCQRGVYPHL